MISPFRKRLEELQKAKAVSVSQQTFEQPEEVIGQSVLQVTSPRSLEAMEQYSFEQQLDEQLNDNQGRVQEYTAKLSEAMNQGRITREEAFSMLEDFTTKLTDNVYKGYGELSLETKAAQFAAEQQLDPSKVYDMYKQGYRPDAVMKAKQSQGETQ